MEVGKTSGTVHSSEVVLVPSTFSARAVMIPIRHAPSITQAISLTGNLDHIKVVAGHQLDSDVGPVSIRVLGPQSFSFGADTDDGGSIRRSRNDIGRDQGGDGGEQRENGEE